jgi:two-component system response regulator AtoC
VSQALKALIIDDEPQVIKFISDVLISDGWSVSEASNAEQGIEMLSEEEWLLIICDVALGESDGYAVLRCFSKSRSTARFILMTGHGSAAGALDATALGASDYLTKPFSYEDILAIAKTVREQYHIQSQAKKSNLTASSEAKGYISDIPLIGNSPKFVECLKMVGRVSVTDFPVLITGESGTGKEVVARAVHRRSTRKDKPFVAVNCGAISVELIESELFGHIKGAFTGAERERRGLWEEADGGTIFLDEITETNQLFQVKLLRALQEGEIRRVGSNQTLKVDVRVIAASNRDVKEEVREGRFRKDLMYRLNAFTINLPPLRERCEDIPLLATRFAKRARPNNKAAVKVSPAALKILEDYYWEGNVRELENAVLYASSLCDRIIYPEHLPEYVRQNDQPGGGDLVNSIGESGVAEDAGTKTPRNDRDWLSLEEMETKYAAEVLSYTGGNKQAAARLLRVDPKTLKRILNRPVREQ